MGMWKDTMQDKNTESAKDSQDAFEKYFKQEEKPNAFVTLLYGDTASGKTYVSMTFPKPVFILDTESRDVKTKFYQFGNDPAIKIYEPIELKTDFNPSDTDALNTHATINNITKFVIDFARQVKEGKIKQGTIVVDSVTDIWSLCQDWGIYELAKYTNKDGTKKADTMLMRLNNQMDWGVINKRHAEILGILRTLIKYGINVVFTAREHHIPDYAKEQQATTKDKIRCQKDVPFLADIIIKLKEVKGQKETKYWASITKLSGKQAPSDYIENLTYDKLHKLLEVEEK